MNGALKMVLSLSLSGALLTLLLLLLRPLLKRRLSMRWQYYIWLVVIARLLLPFAPETNLMGTLFQGADRGVGQVEPAPSPLRPGGSEGVQAPVFAGGGEAGGREPPKRQEPADPAGGPPRTVLGAIWDNLWLGWLVVALLLFVRKITIYQGFVKYIRAGCVEVADIGLLERLGKLVEQSGIKNAVELHTNSLISSPLLVGFFRPCIVLPRADLAPVAFEYTILHELTHFKRRDMFYKWLVQFTVCVHWFNPLVYRMGREVARACELSCDEAVIKALGPQGRRDYGDTLLGAMGAGGSYRDSLASVTLGESKALLKERLDAIMCFQRKSKHTATAAVILAAALCWGAAVAGAYTVPPPDTKPQNNRTNVPSGEKTNIEIDIGRLNQSEEIVFGPYRLQSGMKWEVGLNWDGNGMISLSCKNKNGLSGEQLVQQVSPPISNAFTVQEDGEYLFTITNRAAVAKEYRLEPFVTHLKGNILIGQATGAGTTPPAANRVPVGFTGVSVTGQGPVGVELVKSQEADVAFALLNMDNEENCTTKASIVDGTMQITVNNSAPDGMNINFGPAYKNVVRVYIPDAEYEKFSIHAKEMAVHMQDFNAPIHVETDRAGFWLNDTSISQGTYDIKVTSGPIYIEADTILKDITAEADNGLLMVRFHKTPTNLYLDSTDCGPVVERPDVWPAFYKVGTGTPKIILRNTGKTVIEVDSGTQTK